jgi:hypothetical protein
MIVGYKLAKSKTAILSDLYIPGNGSNTVAPVKLESTASSLENNLDAVNDLPL